VIHWSHGGTTTLSNLVSLCDHHHHVVHQPRPDRDLRRPHLTVTRRDGTELT
jgi:hypothetical protein